MWQFDRVAVPWVQTPLPGPRARALLERDAKYVSPSYTRVYPLVVAGLVARQPLHRQLFGRIFNLVLRIILGLKFKDTQCGFKAFKRSAAQSIFPFQRIERWGFDPELIFLAKKQGLRIVEVPVKWAHDEGGRISPVRDGMRMFAEVLKIRWNSITGKYEATTDTGRVKL